ncbi:hypothetical protein NLI96_g217 [Meripilus lineatus]|uniref:Uncharacterized protein n=1 Tax=Meripilus lineatus TaxID=2056292 RepID=A0AAD5VF59_9APHY|nr:hypothetical protein NLI96_g217 [Physisporinus lineatus]
MASLLIPPPPENARLSQILPTVKCSTCNQPVPISELGDHVCPPAPIIKPPMSPRSTATILSEKYHSLVSRPSTPQSPTHAPSKPSISSPPAQAQSRKSSTAPLRISKPPSKSQDKRTTSPPSNPSLSPRDSRLGQNVPRRPLSREVVSRSSNPPLSPSVGPASPRQRTPSPLATQPPRSAEPPRVSTPLSAGRKSSEALPNTSAPRAYPDSSARSPPPNQSAHTPPSNSTPRSRTTSNASTRPPPVRPPIQPPPVVAPLNLQNNSTPSTASLPSSRQRPNPSNPSLPPINTSPDVIYTTGSHAASPPSNYDPRMHPPPGNRPFSPYGTMSPVVGPGMSPMQAPFSPVVEVDTKTGGEAGMAGVGRRGFAAAARAAMFAQTMGPPPMNGPMNIGIGPGMTFGPQSPEDRAMMASLDAVQGMDGRRPNAPKFLDINSARNYGNNALKDSSPANASTPPLSPNSNSSHSPHSPFSAILASPDKDGRTGSLTPTPPVIASRTPSPSGLQLDGVVSPTPELPLKSPLGQIPPTPTTPSSVRLPFFEKFKKDHPTVDTTPPPASTEPPPLSPSDSESSFGGLAYADSTNGDDEDVPLSKPSEIPRQPSPAETVKQSDVKPEKTPGKVRFPSMSSKKSESAYTSSSSSSSTKSPPVLQRTLSSSTATSSYSIRTTAKSTGALDRAMETLLEETSAETASGSSNSLSEGNNRDSKPPKLPMRSHTSPTLGAGRPESKHGGKRKTAKVRVCAKCEKQIDDGRWIQMEGGNVLCDKCWKNMYLPKPIEGPCAVSHAGDRYHPEHLVCEYARCTERLEEYWEVDGRMLCDRHAQRVMREGDGGEEEDEFREREREGGARAKKRTTRFIDLAAMNANGAGGGHS